MTFEEPDKNDNSYELSDEVKTAIERAVDNMLTDASPIDLIMQTTQLLEGDIHIAGHAIYAVYKWLFDNFDQHKLTLAEIADVVEQRLPSFLAVIDTDFRSEEALPVVSKALAVIRNRYAWEFMRRLVGDRTGSMKLGIVFESYIQTMSSTQGHSDYMFPMKERDYENNLAALKKILTHFGVYDEFVTDELVFNPGSAFMLAIYRQSLNLAGETALLGDSYDNVTARIEFDALLSIAKKHPDLDPQALVGELQEVVNALVTKVSSTREMGRITLVASLITNTARFCDKLSNNPFDDKSVRASLVNNLLQGYYGVIERDISPGVTTLLSVLLDAYRRFLISRSAAETDAAMKYIRSIYKRLPEFDQREAYRREFRDRAYDRELEVIIDCLIFFWKKDLLR